MSSETVHDDFTKGSNSKDLLTADDNAKKSIINVEIDRNGNSNHRPFLISNAIGNNKNLTNCPKTCYDPREFRPKTIICSEIIEKGRLTNRDSNIENSMVKSPTESDEAFFGNLMKRYNEDREKDVRTGFPKRTSRVRKRRGLYSNESLNLIKRFRAEMATKSNRLCDDNGIFSMASAKNSSRRETENFHTPNVTNETIKFHDDDKKKSNVISADTTDSEISSATDRESFRSTPMPFAKKFQNHNY